MHRGRPTPPTIRAPLLPSSLASVRPKQFTAVITAEIFGKITAETLSEILTSYGLSPKLLFTAETAIFGRKWLVSV